MMEIDFDENSVCEVIRTFDDLGFDLKRRLLELTSGYALRNGYYVLYDGIFNGDHIRLGKWYAYDLLNARADFWKRVDDPEAENCRLLLLEIE